MRRRFPAALAADRAVARDRIWRLVGPQISSSPANRFLLGRALGRVLVHEPYRTLAQTLSHGKYGVTKALLKDDQRIGFTGLNPGNRRVPFLGHDVVLRDLLQAYGARGSGIFDRGVVEGRPWSDPCLPDRRHCRGRRR